MIVTYWVTLQNDGTGPDRFRLHGAASSTHFRVRYFAGPTEITGQVAAGTYLTPEVAPGAARAIRMTVRVKQSAPRNSSARG